MGNIASDDYWGGEIPRLINYGRHGRLNVRSVKLFTDGKRRSKANTTLDSNVFKAHWVHGERHSWSLTRTGQTPPVSCEVLKKCWQSLSNNFGKTIGKLYEADHTHKTVVLNTDRTSTALATGPTMSR